MSRAIIGTLVITTVLALCSGQAFAVLEQGRTLQLNQALAVRPASAPNSITVRFKPTTQRERAANVVADMACSVAFASPSIPGLMDLKIPAGTTVGQMIAEFSKRSDVLYAEPSYLDYPADTPALTPNDPLFGLQWHMTQIGCESAWDRVGGGSSTIIVAVIDTGVSFENYVDGADTFALAPDLDGVNFVSPRDVIASDAHPNDDNRHGTHVTGTIAQRTGNSVGTAGVAYNTSIMPIRVLGTGGDLHAQFATGVDWAIAHGAHIINYSAGGSDSTTKHDAVIAAQAAGVLFIAAMGNEGSSTAGSRWPGAYAEAVGVSAVGPTKVIAPYSNTGSGTDIAGPGGDMSSAAADGVLQNTFASGGPYNVFAYHYLQGTSMATPHVAGLAALVWSHPSYNTAAAVRDRIYATAEDIGTAGDDSTYGRGLIRADLAIPASGAPTPPTLALAGTTGYTTDGVAPDTGSPDSTSFTFKVKYTDVNGDAPIKRYCRISWLDCDGRWKVFKNIKLQPEAGGSYASGKIYGGSTTLPNRVWKYKFVFADNDGEATGGPTKNKQGPQVSGTAFLCWSGATGYGGVDGVNPNSGPPGTPFRFRVVYRDSWGTAPVTANLEIRRGGNIVETRAMNNKGGDYRTGRVYAVKNRLKRPLSNYEYRFVFDDGGGPATGNPAAWTAGPDTTASDGVLALTGVSAAQTSVGAQLNFTLSSAADVTATVINVAGRPIRTIVTDSPMDEGINTLLWDRRDENGLNVPSGLYMIRVDARDPGGAQTSGMATVPLR